MPKGVDKQIGTLATIESEGHFFQVRRKMFGADFVPRSDDAALEQRERRLNGVRVNLTLKVDMVLCLIVSCREPCTPALIMALG